MIRHATHDDIPALIELVLGFFANGELDGTGLTPDRDTIEFLITDYIESDQHAVFVVEDGGVIIAASAACLVPWVFNYDQKIAMETVVVGEGLAPLRSIRRAFAQWGKVMGAVASTVSSPPKDKDTRRGGRSLTECTWIKGLEV